MYSLSRGYDQEIKQVLGEITTIARGDLALKMLENTFHPRRYDPSATILIPDNLKKEYHTQNEWIQWHPDKVIQECGDVS